VAPERLHLEISAEWRARTSDPARAFSAPARNPSAEVEVLGNAESERADDSQGRVFCFGLKESAEATIAATGVSVFWARRMASRA
jgi:hypothetical protein